MASTRTHDILATVGRYKLEGKRMKRSVRVGSGFTDAQGRLYLRLDSVPICPEWSGWLSLFPVRKNDESAPLLPFEEDILGDALGEQAEGMILANEALLPEDILGATPPEADDEG